MGMDTFSFDEQIDPTKKPAAAAPAGVGASTASPLNASDPFAESYQTPGDQHVMSSSPKEGILPDQVGSSNPNEGIAPQVKSSSPTEGVAPVDAIQQTLKQASTATDPQAQVALKDQASRDIASALTAAGHKVTWDGDTLVVDGRPYSIAGGSAAPSVTTNDPVGSSSPTEGMITTHDPVGSSSPTEGVPPSNVGTNPGQTAGPNWASIGAGGPDWIATPGGGWIPPSMVASPTPGPPIGSSSPTEGVPPAKSASTSWSPTAPTYTPGAVPTDDLQGFGVDDTLARMGATTPVNAPQLKESYDPGAVDQGLGGMDLKTLLGMLPASDAVPQLNESYAAGSVNPSAPDAYRAGTLDGVGAVGPNAVGAATDAGAQDLLAHPESLDATTVAAMKAKNREQEAEMAQQADRDLQGFGAQAGITDSNWLAGERAANLRSRDEAVLNSNRNIEIQAATQNKADARAALSLGSDVSNTEATNTRADASLKLYQQLQQQGLDQAAIQSKMAAAGFEREGQVLNEQLRGQAFDRQNAATQQNITNLLTTQAAQRSAVGQATSTALSAEGQKQAGQEANASIAATQFTNENAATQQNINNLFKSREDQQQAVSLASDKALSAATLTGDRMQLRESINQKAAELGQSADQLQLSYTMGLLANAMQKYGIDTSAATSKYATDTAAKTAAGAQDVQRYGIDTSARLDSAKLAEMGREFQEDLAYRLEALGQANDQFAANFGLQSWKAQDDSNQGWFDRTNPTASA